MLIYHVDDCKMDTKELDDEVWIRGVGSIDGCFDTWRVAKSQGNTRVLAELEH